ncbi:hypothetical protein ATC00_08590 [Sinorhizobium americanum]|nr:hypothetical protein ATC00_08590 [Sinorhizobium americanum]
MIGLFRSDFDNASPAKRMSRIAIYDHDKVKISCSSTSYCHLPRLGLKEVALPQPGRQLAVLRRRLGIWEDRE